MNIERAYIKELLEEVNGKDYDMQRVMEEKEQLEQSCDKLKEGYEELLVEKKKLEQEMYHLKNNLKADFSRTTITNPEVINIFEKIKEGEIIYFLTPEANKKYTQYKTNPFVFKLDNKGAIFDGKLLGMFEIKKGNIYYYNEALSTRIMGGEISKQILNITENTLNCQYKSRGMKKSIRVSRMTWEDILKKNPVINIGHNKLVSINGCEYAYTKQDGSKYIILENGEKEII